MILSSVVLLAGCGGGGGGGTSAAQDFDLDITSPTGNLTITKGQSVNFQSTASDGTDPYSFEWNFGGGATNSNLEDPGIVTFNTAGTFTVTLTATDDAGGTATAAVRITVNDGSGGGSSVLGLWRISKEEEDRDADGITDYTTYYSYDSQGRQVGYEYHSEWGVDIITYTSSNGNIFVHQESNHSGTGYSSVGTSDTTYEGSLLKPLSRSQTSQSTGLSGDSAYQSETTWSYDSHGNVVREETSTVTTGTYSGTDTYVTTYTNSYDTAGRLIKVERDYQDDGTIDGEEIFSRDSSGDIIERRDIYYSYDQTSTYIYNISYDDDDLRDNMGHLWLYDLNIMRQTQGLLGQDREEIDYGNDGSIDVVLHSTYNSKFDLIGEEEDSNRDGVVETITHTLTYDSNGLLIRDESPEDGIEQYTWIRL